MEFLELVTIYVLLFFASVGFYFYGNASIFKRGFIGKLQKLIIMVCIILFLFLFLACKRFI